MCVYVCVRVGSQQTVVKRARTSVWYWKALLIHNRTNFTQAALANFHSSTFLLGPSPGMYATRTAEQLHTLSHAPATDFGFVSDDFLGEILPGNPGNGKALLRGWFASWLNVTWEGNSYFASSRKTLFACFFLNYLSYNKYSFCCSFNAIQSFVVVVTRDLLPLVLATGSCPWTYLFLALSICALFVPWSHFPWTDKLQLLWHWNMSEHFLECTILKNCKMNLKWHYRAQKEAPNQH